jgi:aspartyl-tRNA(Asn)/glutamyl-tRNA(Gln) amidotransferase subunit B
MASDYEIVIGLEVHCQLRTATKMFCACGYSATSNRVASEPNTQIDAYTLALPGTLPVPNRAAVEAALRLALALGCEVQSRSRWARKHYFYPDLPKGYQITQADQPYAIGGAVEIPDRTQGDDALASKSIPLQRIHIEEDAGKSNHVGDRSLVDFNRAGAPLVEIVSLPVLRSAAEAADYMRELRTMVRHLGISEANMEEGTLRCDANVSLRPRGSAQLGVRCEIKNLNSFRFLESAIEAEVRRQLDLLARGEAIVSSTLGYDPERDRITVMRSKEAAADYRYFPEPDMPPLQIDAEWIERVRAELPELPWARRRRFAALGLSAYDVGVLTAERELADYFDAALASEKGVEAKPLCNWLTSELLALLHAEKLDLADCPVRPAKLARLVALVEDGTISGSSGKKVLQQMFRAPDLDPEQIVEQGGFRQVSDLFAIETMLRDVVAKHPGEFEQLRAGKDKLRGFFVGLVMRASSGKANPQLVQQALDALLREPS